MRRLAAVVGLVAAGLLLTACSSGGRTAGGSVSPSGATFENPIVQTGEDPWVSRFDGAHWLVQAVSNTLVVTRSTTLTGLGEGTATTVWTPPQAGSHCTDLWAPELHEIDHHWWVYYAATTCDHDNANHRMFALESTSDDPSGHYVDRGEVRDAAGRWAIDGTRITWKGVDWFVWSGWPGDRDGRQNLLIARMSSPTTLVGTGTVISEPTLGWEQRGAPIEEGPEGLVHDGVLRIVYSASGSWTDSYCLGMLTLTGANPAAASSWTKTPQPVFAGTAHVTSPGHASFTTSPDGREQWIVYHSAREPGAGWDRVIDTQRFTWTTNGAPAFGEPVEPDVAELVPSGQTR